jgi:hypothetical protein
MMSLLVREKLVAAVADGIRILDSRGLADAAGEYRIAARRSVICVR